MSVLLIGVVLCGVGFLLCITKSRPITAVLSKVLGLLGGPTTFDTANFDFGCIMLFCGMCFIFGSLY